MIQLFCERSKCCGCSACMNICPQKAITMVREEEGFLYPEINPDKCVECGACKKMCTFGDERKPTDCGQPKKVLAVKHGNETVRTASSSGGVFTAMYEKIISAGGAVYGVKFDEKFHAVFARAESKPECEVFRGSKYIQSDVGNTYAKVKNDLKDGRAVLFSGTPCQVAALRHYLKDVNTERLIMCDIVCHGVPSPMVWQDYLRLVGGKSGIRSVSFREKSRVGWHKSQLRIEKNNGDVLLEGKETNAFFKLFFNHYILRPSCYECPYANMKRTGDITIGDFWGIEKSMPEFDDDKGISLVLINTEKGLAFFESIRDETEVRESDTEKCLQPNLIRPGSKPANRELFWIRYRKKGLKYVLKLYTPYGSRFVSVRLRKKLHGMLKKFRG